MEVNIEKSRKPTSHQKGLRHYKKKNSSGVVFYVHVTVNLSELYPFRRHYSFISSSSPPPSIVSLALHHTP